MGRDLDALEAELDEPIARVKRQLAIAIGSGDVRLPGVDAMLVTNAIAAGRGRNFRSSSVSAAAPSRVNPKIAGAGRFRAATATSAATARATATVMRVTAGSV